MDYSVWKLSLIYTSAKLYCRNSHRKMFHKKEVLKYFVKFTRKHLPWSLSLNLKLTTCNFIKKETLAQLFSCEFLWESFQNSHTAEQPWATVSDKTVTCCSEVVVYSRAVLKVSENDWGNTSVRAHFQKSYRFEASNSREMWTLHTNLSVRVKRATLRNIYPRLAHLLILKLSGIHLVICPKKFQKLSGGHGCLVGEGFTGCCQYSLLKILPLLTLSCIML